MIEPSDNDLVKVCLKGKIAAFETLIERYQKPIFNLAFRMLNDYEDAQDVAQTVFVKAFEKLATFNFRFKFFSWIYRIAVNESLNVINQRQQIEQLDHNLNLISEEKSPAEHYQNRELNRKIQMALMNLKIDYRAVIVLRYFEEFSYNEMSYILEIPEKTVKSRLFSARQQLRKILLLKGYIENDG
ncbi:MAG: RNA polymerase sigma factor [bacterium]